MFITVLVPTYARPDDLDRCLKALQQQIRLADEVLVVVQERDHKTHAFLQQFNPEALPLKPIIVDSPGQVFALNAGLDAAQGDIIAITDDDAAPHANWLERIEHHFQADPQLGGIGGRDWMYLNGELQEAAIHPGASGIVGRLQWHGRTIGNHHLGVGSPQAVDWLKGANMSYRQTAIAGLRFDTRLKGAGAQTNNDWGFSMTVKQRGWKLLYDPSVAVDHYLGQRFNQDQRIQFNYAARVNSAHNEALVLLEKLPLQRRIVYLFWAVLIGTRSHRGLLQMLRFLLDERSNSIQCWVASMHGLINAIRTWQRVEQL
jgi:glycosyltransferase involved in cell wall biosynthesis